MDMRARYVLGPIQTRHFKSTQYFDKKIKRYCHKKIKRHFSCNIFEQFCPIDACLKIF